MTDSTLKPIVGIVVTTSPIYRLPSALASAITLRSASHLESVQQRRLSRIVLCTLVVSARVPRHRLAAPTSPKIRILISFLDQIKALNFEMYPPIVTFWFASLVLVAADALPACRWPVLRGYREITVLEKRPDTNVELRALCSLRYVTRC